jgi:hypothetical protein
VIWVLPGSPSLIEEGNGLPFPAAAALDGLRHRVIRHALWFDPGGATAAQGGVSRPSPPLFEYHRSDTAIGARTLSIPDNSPSQDAVFMSIVGGGFPAAKGKHTALP